MEHVIRVQDHKVKYSNRNNSAADCSISLKFRTEFDRVKPVYYTCSRSKVKGQGHGVKVQGQRNITYCKNVLRRQQIGRASLNLTRATKLKRIGTARRRAASSCNAFAIATFSSFYSVCKMTKYLLSLLSLESLVVSVRCKYVEVVVNNALLGLQLT